MNAFQILDKEGNAIPIGTLDREVCKIIGVDVDPKHYCKLGRRDDYPEGFKGEFDYQSNTYNWYDTIGWMIADANLTLQDILQYYADNMKDYIGKQDENGNTITLETIYPYHTKVLNTWISKGYTTKQIKENNEPEY